MPEYKDNCRARAGFTLIDIVLVMAIIGVMLAFAVPSMLRSRAIRHLDKAVSTLVAELGAARTYARSGSRSVVIDLDTSARTLTVKIDHNDNGTFEVGEQSVVEISRMNAITVTSPVTTGTFDSRGNFSCTQSSWKIAVTSPDAGTEYVYAFRGGQISRSKESL